MAESVPTYELDLSLPPKHRWDKIADIYASQFHNIEKEIDELVASQLGPFFGPMLESVVSNIFAGLSRIGVVYYGEELEGLSKRSGMALGKLTLMQLIYEACACCTSIVLNSPSGPPIHIRTMDWGMDFLHPLTINLIVRDGGKHLFTATTWAGYVGVLTGMKPGAYSVSVNFRTVGGTFWSNLKRAMFRSWPIGFLLREVLQSTPDFDTAVGQLALSPLIAPCYFTVCGVRPNEGALITRLPECEEDRWTLSANGPIVQTNIEHWSNDRASDILQSIQRRHTANEAIRDLISDQWDDTSVLWHVISIPPITNQLTIYGTLMDPTNSKLETRMCIPGIGFIAPQPSAMPPCAKCGRPFLPTANDPGHCAHSGRWHSTYDDCSFVKCGFELGKKWSISRCHWSCCYSLNFDSPCTKSGPHQ